ncbi:MAG: PDZ domain-containing protein [Nitrososphaera sp.]|jgi:S1-C subfamily serine protease
MTHHPVDSIAALAILAGVVAGSFAYVGTQPVAYIGITVTDVNAEIAQQMRLPSDKGVLIVQVAPSSPAEKAGLKGGDRVVVINGEDLKIGGDVVTASDGKPVSSVDELQNQLSDKKINDRVTFTVQRGPNETKDVTFTIEAHARP